MALTKIPGSLIEATGNLTITDLTVTGDLSITGDLNSYNVTDLDVVDQTITLGAGQTEALSGGSGIIVDGSNASILWDETNTEFDINSNLKVATDTTLSFASDTVNSITLGTSGTNKPCIKFDTADTTHTNRVWAIENGAGGRLNFFRNGLDVLKLNQDGSVEIPGNVGIGTDNPASALEVNNGSAGDTVATFEGSYGAGGDVQLVRYERAGGAVYGAISYKDATTDMEFGNISSHALSFITGNTRRLTIDSSGNVGIGVTPKGYHSDYKAIDINNSASVMGYTGNNGAWLMENLYFGTDNNWKHKNSDFSALVEMYDGVFNFYNTASGTAGATATLQNRLKIDQSGNVGIGTSYNANYDASLQVVANNTHLFDDFTSNLVLLDDAGAQGGSGGHLLFAGNDGSSSRGFCKIVGGKANSTSGNYAGQLTFKVRANGEGTMREAFRINTSESVFNETSQDIDFRVEGDTAQYALFVDASNDVTSVGSSGTMNAAFADKRSIGFNIDLPGIDDHGGHMFMTQLAAEDAWIDICQCHDANATGVLFFIHGVRTVDQNRSYGAMVRYAYNNAFNIMSSNSQNATVEYRVSNDMLQYRFTTAGPYIVNLTVMAAG